MNPVGWFEIPVNDMKRARNFYEVVLGLELSLSEMGPTKMAWFPMGNEEYGATGSLVQGDDYKVSACGTTVYFSVPDIEAGLARVEKLGGKTLMAKTSIGEYGHIAKFLDSEGNQVAFHTPPKM